MSGILTWPGPHHFEAKQAYIRAREAGMSLARSWIVGGIASFRDAWLFRSALARFFRLSIRTVQRAITEAHDLGLIGKARSKPNEIPPGANTPIPCGWSHRWTVGWGMAVEVARAEIARTRLARIVKAQTKRPEAPRYPARKTQWSPEEIQAVIDSQVRQPPKDYGQRPPRSKWTVEEIEAELAKLKRERQNE